MSSKIISLVDFSDSIIYEDRFSSLPIKEDGIVNKSIELFHDSEPCIIHRTFIMKKFYFEMDKYLDCLLKDGMKEVSYDILPDWIREMLDIGRNTKKILIGQ